MEQKTDFDRGYYAGFYAALLRAHKAVDEAWLDSGRGKKANNEALEQVRADLKRVQAMTAESSPSPGKLTEAQLVVLERGIKNKIEREGAWIDNVRGDEILSLIAEVRRSRAVVGDVERARAALAEYDCPLTVVGPDGDGVAWLAGKFAAVELAAYEKAAGVADAAAELQTEDEAFGQFADDIAGAIRNLAQGAET